MTFKTCPKCRKTLPVENFHWKHIDKKRRSYCKKCVLEINKQYYLKNRKKITKQKSKRLAELRNWFREMKKTLKCVMCEESHFRCLEFHHKDPNKKDFIVSEMLKNNSATRIIEEMSKCVVLCANCHRKLHYEIELREGKDG